MFKCCEEKKWGAEIENLCGGGLLSSDGGEGSSDAVCIFTRYTLYIKREKKVLSHTELGSSYVSSELNKIVKINTVHCAWHLVKDV